MSRTPTTPATTAASAVSAATPPTAADERDLVARLQKGEAAAYEQVVRDNGPRMLAVARRILTDESDAQDAVQEAFLSAFRSIAKFEGGSLVSTWLHRITVNACLMRLRKKRRLDEVSLDGMLPGFSPEGYVTKPTDTWVDRPSSMEQAELRATVRAAIDKLPEHYRIVLILRDIEAMDTAQTASLLETTEAAVKIRLHRARQALRELLDPSLRDHPDSSAVPSVRVPSPKNQSAASVATKNSGA
ncbi:MAG: sigma-70 family RNA polymerase sigma factor [Phycisphaerales bacterium]|nr:sigma-70 family RNA polymerase sigma factor [Phycisphaerales bacterium]